jgi:hypothetical protein
VTKVPLRSKVYKNRYLFDNKLCELIDTNTFYYEYNTNVNCLERYNIDSKDNFYGVYKFYGNGNLNYFMIDKNKYLKNTDFDPDYGGYRGIYYSGDNEIRFDIFVRINSWGWFGKSEGSIYVRGDTLFVKKDVSHYPKIYIKMDIDRINTFYRGNW